MREISFPVIVTGHPLRPDEEPPVEPAKPYRGPRGLGLGIPWQMSLDAPVWKKIVAELQPAWWVDWRYEQIEQPSYCPLWFEMRPGGEWLSSADWSRQHPGHFWLCGNEPDRVATKVEPVEAAESLRDWLAYAPTVFAAPGVQLNKGGYAWLARYLDAAGPLPDAWHVHLYCANAAHGLNLLREFETWLYQHDLPGPILLSETAVYNGTPQRQVDWWRALRAEIARPDSRLVAAAHFAAYWADWPWCCLTDPFGNLRSPLARLFYEIAHAPST